MANMSEEDLRRWAIEQVMAHRQGNGFTLDRVLDEVETLIAFVKDGKKK